MHTCSKDPTHWENFKRSAGVGWSIELGGGDPIGPPTPAITDELVFQSVVTLQAMTTMMTTMMTAVMTTVITTMMTTVMTTVMLAVMTTDDTKRWQTTLLWWEIIVKEDLSSLALLRPTTKKSFEKLTFWSQPERGKLALITFIEAKIQGSPLVV